MSLARLLELDARYSAWMQVMVDSGPLRTAAAVLAHSGDSWFWLAGLALLWLLGDAYWKARAAALAIGIVVTAVAVMVIKFSVRRRRPAGEWGSIYRKSDPHSFPSGHAARGAMLATLALLLGPAWLGWLLAVWGPLVGLARVGLGVHYWSDVAVGMLLGVALGLVIFQFLPR